MATITATTTQAPIPNYYGAGVVQNLGPADIFVGPVGVTAATGVRISVGSHRDNFPYKPSVITLAGTADVRYETAT